MAPSAAVKRKAEKATQQQKWDAKELLASADALLQEVEDSPFLQRGGRRSYPTFDKEEVLIGPLLGVGGFCSVLEVKGFDLKKNTITTETKAADGAADDDAEGADDADDDAEDDPLALEAAKDAAAAAAVLDATDKHEHEEKHYDLTIARQHMNDNAKRNGTDARYAIKRLHTKLNVHDRARGSIDLAIEAKLLSVLWHPNIVKMRAMASGPIMDRKFFIIMDRLYQTLDQRMKDWSAMYNSAKGGLFGMGAKKEQMNHLMLERLVVAFDLASAFEYMHENKLVYRDTKKENIGFDVRNDVKIFDFGLSKCLTPALKAKDDSGREVYGYNLTPRTGSIPFMAPEIVECKPYDEKCDVFSFAILTWEMFALKPAFKGYNRGEYLERVVRGEQRLPIGRNWPALTRGMIREAWDNDPQKRPTMKRIGAMMRGDMREMSSDPTIRERSAFMRNRSAHSVKRLHIE